MIDARNDGTCCITHRDNDDVRNPVVNFPIVDGEQVDDLVDRFARTFPKEMRACAADVAEEKKNQLRSSGTSRARLQKPLCSIPGNLFLLIEEVDPEYWSAGGAHRFARSYPSLRRSTPQASRGIHT